MANTPELDGAWAALNAALAFAVDHVTSDRDPLNEAELADGNQYVLRILAAVTESSLLTFDPGRPAFMPMLESVRFLGAAGPDIDYDVALVEPGVPHRIEGSRGQATFVGIAVYGHAGEKGASAIVDSIDVDQLCDANGDFVHEFTHPDAARVIIRQYFHDRATQSPGSWSISRLDGVDAPHVPDPPASVVPDRVGATPAAIPALVGRVTNAAQSIRWNAQLNTLWTPELRESPNRLVRQSAEEIVAAVTNPDVTYAFSWWRLEPGQLLVIDVDPPDCAYWSIQLCDRWFQCHPDRRTNLNDRQLVRSPDGSVRIVLAHQDPGHPNWLETSGHRTGTMFFRWLHTDPQVLPTCTVIDRDSFTA